MSHIAGSEMRFIVRVFYSLSIDDFQWRIDLSLQKGLHWHKISTGFKHLVLVTLLLHFRAAEKHKLRDSERYL
jgi:hypothetical protein